MGRVVIAPLDDRWLAALVRGPWSGLHAQDGIQAGWLALTGSQRALLGAAIILKPTSSRVPLVFAVNPLARQPAVISSALAEQLPMEQPICQRNWVDADSAERRALEHVGFRVGEHGHVFDIDYAGVSDRLDRLSVALDRSRPLQAGQTISPWKPEFHAQVRRIAESENIAEAALVDATLTTGTTQSFCPEASALAFIDGRLVGFFISVRRGALYEIALRWVAPEHRGGWVNGRLMIHCLQAARGLGDFEGVRFNAVEEMHPETHRLMERFGGRLHARCVRMRRN